jgi:hypothetical protein
LCTLHSLLSRIFSLEKRTTRVTDPTVSNVSLTDLSRSGSILDFSLDDGEYGVGAIVYTTGMTANVSYEFAVNSSVSSVSTTSATTPSTTPTNPSRASVMDSSLGLVIAISLAVVLFCGP